jgi:hypothetical protein
MLKRQTGQFIRAANEEVVRTITGFRNATLPGNIDELAGLSAQIREINERIKAGKSGSGVERTKAASG